MGKLNNYFLRKEFACKCGCGQDTVDYTLMEVLVDLRKTFGKPVLITSANRCKEHNAKVGGSKNSVHLTGKAADVVVKGVEPSEVQAYLKGMYIGKYGIGSYEDFTHIDVRDGCARWDG